MEFYDYEFNLLLAEPKVISWKFTKLFNGIGTFVARLPLSSAAVPLIAERNHIVCGFGGEFAIVTGTEIADELVIYGRSLNWLLSKRILLPQGEKSCNTTDFVKEAFEKCYSECNNAVFEGGVSGEMHSFLIESPKYLSDAVFDALSADGLGNDMIFDTQNRRWLFCILKGSDKNLMVSEANKNASSTRIITNMADYANLCYYEGEGGYLSMGSGESGIYRFEAFVNSENAEDAQSELLKREKEKSTHIDTTKLVYKRDYLLGDRVRVQLIKGAYRVTDRLKITGVEMNMNTGGYCEKPIFEEKNN